MFLNESLPPQFILLVKLCESDDQNYKEVAGVTELSILLLFL